MRQEKKLFSSTLWRLMDMGRSYLSRRNLTWRICLRNPSTQTSMSGIDDQTKVLVSTLNHSPFFAEVKIRILESRISLYQHFSLNRSVWCPEQVSSSCEDEPDKVFVYESRHSHTPLIWTIHLLQYKSKSLWNSAPVNPPRHPLLSDC